MDKEWQFQCERDDTAAPPICERAECWQVLKGDQEIRTGVCDKHLREALENLE